jgi:hypothetical protein
MGVAGFYSHYEEGISYIDLQRNIIISCFHFNAKWADEDSKYVYEISISSFWRLIMVILADLKVAESRIL